MTTSESKGNNSDLDPAGNFHGLRELIREANAPIAAAVFSEFIPEDRPLLELGCGTGELYRMMPEAYRQVYTGIEIDPGSLELNRARHPEANLIEGDATNLPFENNSVPTIVALDLLDIVEPDHMAAVREIKRVLQPGGVFIHFHDCRPNMDFVARQVPRQFIPFPYFEQNGLLCRFQLLPAADYARYKKDDQLDYYVSSVRQNINLLEPSRKSLPSEMDRLAELVSQRFAGRLSLSSTFREIFNQTLHLAAINSGFKIVEQSQRRGETTMTPQQIDTLLATDPSAPVSYNSGNILFSEENGGLIVYPGLTDDAAPPTYVSSLNVLILQKSLGRPKSPRT